MSFYIMKDTYMYIKVIFLSLYMVKHTYAGLYKVWSHDNVPLNGKKHIYTVYKELSHDVSLYMVKHTYTSLLYIKCGHMMCPSKW